ncbi:GntR family transcriptional regulator [Kitasatospora sp. NPDC059795]|uniref:GntR family transcriptional regulator n=1 Tax=Kitasatospora sp. NPDC059795 TaxID=3346949 RepID=UPI003661DB4B
MAGYIAIAAHFEGLIESGELQPGDRLPPQREVMQQWGVAAQTAGRAFKRLRDKGLTVATTGGGTVVAPRGSDNVASRVQAWAATGRALKKDESSEILEVGTVGASETVAARLEIEPGSPVQLRRRLVRRGGVPVHVSSSYYPLFVVEATPELAEPVSTGASRELAAERLGSVQERVLEEVTAREATEQERQALGLTGSVIVQQVVRTVYLADGRVVEVAIKVVNGETVLRWSTQLN